MGNRYLLDTYVIVQSIKSGLELPQSNYFISEITPQEIFSCEGLQKSERMALEEIFSTIHILQQNETIIKNAKMLQEKYHLTHPDALQASFALSYNLILLTNDLTFKDVQEITVEPFYFI